MDNRKNEAFSEDAEDDSNEKILHEKEILKIQEELELEELRKFKKYQTKWIFYD